MQKRDERKYRPQKDALVRTVQAHYEERLKEGAIFRVTRASNTVFQVKDLKGEKGTVELGEDRNGCDCRHAYQYQAPYKHMLAAMLHIDNDPFENICPQLWMADTARSMMRVCIP